MCPHPFFEAAPLGAAPGPPVKTGARVRHFRGCNQFPVPWFLWSLLSELVRCHLELLFFPLAQSAWVRRLPFASCLGGASAHLREHLGGVSHAQGRLSLVPGHNLPTRKHRRRKHHRRIRGATAGRGLEAADVGGAVDVAELQTRGAAAAAHQPHLCRRVAVATPAPAHVRRRRHPEARRGAGEAEKGVVTREVLLTAHGDESGRHRAPPPCIRRGGGACGSPPKITC